MPVTRYGNGPEDFCQVPGCRNRSHTATLCWDHYRLAKVGGPVREDDPLSIAIAIDRLTSTDAVECEYVQPDGSVRAPDPAERRVWESAMESWPVLESDFRADRDADLAEDARESDASDDDEREAA